MKYKDYVNHLQTTKENSIYAVGTKPRMSAYDIQLLVMVFLLSFTLLALTGLQHFHQMIYLIIDGEQSAQQYAEFILHKNISTTLTLLNAAIKIIIYCLSGNKFRQDLVLTVTCKSTPSIKIQFFDVQDDDYKQQRRSATVQLPTVQHSNRLTIVQPI